MEYELSVQEDVLPDPRRLLGETANVETETGYMQLSKIGKGAAFGCSTSIFYVQVKGDPADEDYARIIDHEAAEMGCLPQLVGPVECLDLPSDPVACSEGS